MESADVNPYESPQARLIEDAVPDPRQPPRPRWFRWRVIPVTLLYLYAAAWLFQAVMGIAALGWFLFISQPEQRPGPATMAYLLTTPIGGVLAFLSVIAGRNLWKGRWRRGICFVIAVATVFAAAAVLQNSVFRTICDS
jgi:hypothetical protein